VRHGNWRPAALLLALAILSTSVRADGYDERRVQTGLRLFRAMLAADTQLPSRAGADGQLLVLFVHAGDRHRGEQLADTFLKRGGVAEPVRGLPVRVEVVSAAGLPAWGGQPAAVFVAEPATGALLRGIVDFGIRRRLIVYSPFEGHVESGVLGGLAIEAQVRPYVNLATLEASSVSLKDFFLKVAKVHR
jgi:hypothetical protein